MMDEMNMECTLFAVDPAVVVSLAKAFDLDIWIRPRDDDSIIVQVAGAEDDVCEFEEEVYMYECECL
jgi:acylphosphatase